MRSGEHQTECGSDDGMGGWPPIRPVRCWLKMAAVPSIQTG
jgi:hypothetical protein